MNLHVYRTHRWHCILIGVIWLIPQCAVRAAETADSHKLHVVIYADEGASKKGSPHVQRCLPAEMDFAIKTVTAEDIRNGALDEVDVLIHPGGSGSKQAETLGEEGRERVRKFVRNGGGYVGICAGAYLGSANYPWSLNLLNARVVDSKHWARGKGEVQLRLPAEGRAALGVDQEIIPIHYAQGPLLAPGDKEDVPAYEILAAFETEIAENGAPKGVMIGTTAIARGTFGEGRVVLFSPHPEKTAGRDSFVRAMVLWAAGLAARVGEEVTLRGRFNGPGKIGDFIVTDNQQVYLVGNNQPTANTTTYGAEVTVRGKLQRFVPPPSDDLTQTNAEQSARPPKHYFIESAALVHIH